VIGQQVAQRAASAYRHRLPSRFGGGAAQNLTNHILCCSKISVNFIDPTGLPDAGDLPVWLASA
jgi:5-methylcytosine-specific restriction endonuclease McrA